MSCWPNGPVWRFGQRRGWFSLMVAFFFLGLIILNAWYGKFVTDNSRKNERAKVIDVTVPLQCLVKDSKLFLAESSKVQTM